jgi:hypothetical protein
MKKDAYYFPHFSNARNDAKLIKIRRVLGLEGYAIYFMLLEILREQTDFKYPLNGIDDLSFEWHTSKEKIYSVITQFELFQVDEKNFFSAKLIYYLQPYLEKTERAKNAANIRWENTQKQIESKCNADQNANAYANALQIESKCNADQNARRGEERRGEENKEEDINIVEKIPPNPKKFKKPTIEEIQSYCDEIKISIDVNHFYDYYESNGWKTGKNSMKDWKAAIRNWNRNNFSGSKAGKREDNFTVPDYIDPQDRF